MHNSLPLLLPKKSNIIFLYSIFVIFFIKFADLCLRPGWKIPRDVQETFKNFSIF